MPDWSEMVAMLLMGLLGTAHCIGMCGPLVAILPAGTGAWRVHLAYNLGRITMYTALGALLGLLGGGLRAAGAGDDSLAWVARIQIMISLLAASMLLVLGLARIGLIREPSWMAVATPGKIPGFRRVHTAALNRRRVGATYLFGVFMGLLPCGLSYAAFARAAAAQSMAEGASLVAAFGLGTLPGLFLVGMGLAPFLRRARTLSNVLSGLVMIGMGLSLMADALLTTF